MGEFTFAALPAKIRKSSEIWSIFTQWPSGLLLWVYLPGGALLRQALGTMWLLQEDPLVLQALRTFSTRWPCRPWGSSGTWRWIRWWDRDVGTDAAPSTTIYSPRDYQHGCWRHHQYAPICGCGRCDLSVPGCHVTIWNRDRGSYRPASWSRKPDVWRRHWCIPRKLDVLGRVHSQNNTTQMCFMCTSIL